MKKELVWRIIAGAGVFVAMTGAAHAQVDGCVDSPENPTAVLGLLGAASAGVPWLRAKWLSRKSAGQSGAQSLK